MIKRYSDHAANERTFLAWVRAAIAVMAFGFVIERFDLFLPVAAPRAAMPKIAPHNQAIANAAGLAFVAIGVITIIIAAFRFARIAKAKETEDALPRPGERFDIPLSVLIGLLGVSLFLYLLHA